MSKELYRKSVGNKIRMIRLEKGMTLEEFGSLFNTSKSSVLGWETGRNLPNKSRLKKIADLANITVEELLEEQLIIKASLGEKIRSIRLERGETMEEFGRNFNPNANRSLVSAWENGRYVPNPERLKQIAKIGDMTVKELLNENPLHNYSTEELQAEIDRRKSPHGNADLEIHYKEIIHENQIK